MKLNLGCGDRLLDGWENVDFYYPKADRKVDLFTFPWPWETSSVDAVAMSHFLEHVPDLDRTILEVHRILKPNGEFRVTVPHAHNSIAHSIGHRWHFTWKTFQDLSSGVVPWYMWPQPRLFRETCYRCMVGNRVLNWLASRYPHQYEKVGLFNPQEIEWRGEAIKEPAVTTPGR